MKKSLLFLCLTVLSCYSYSQSDFREGYVITLANDTLKGQVNYKEGNSAFTSCEFRESANHATKTYKPIDIAAYGFVKDKQFIAHKVSSFEGGIHHEFIEELVRGVVNLYTNRGYFYVNKNSDSLLLLTNKAELINVNGQDIVKNSNQHIAILNLLISECTSLRERIQKVKLSEFHLTMLVEDYNKCMGQVTTTFKSTKPWIKTTLGLSAGVNFSSLIFDGGNEGDVKFEKTTSPMIGLSFIFSSPRLSERFAFHGDLFYLNSTHFLYNKTEQPDYSQIDYITIKLQQLKIPISIQYTFPERPITPYLRFGISSTIHLSSSSIWTAEIVQDNVLRTYSGEALTIKDRQFGYWVGLGIYKSVSKKFIAFSELRYEQTNGLVDTDSTFPFTSISTIKNLQLILGLRLK